MLTQEHMSNLLKMTCLGASLGLAAALAMMITLV